LDTRHFVGEFEDKPRASEVNVGKTTNPLMLYYCLVFLLVAIVAGVLGFWGIAGIAGTIAKVLFVVFLILFILSLLRGRR
jgi:uncharacterized membrane protein YtjA (UPF0391 family)